MANKENTWNPSAYPLFDIGWQAGLITVVLLPCLEQKKKKSPCSVIPGPSAMLPIRSGLLALQVGSQCLPQKEIRGRAVAQFSP